MMANRIMKAVFSTGRMTAILLSAFTASAQQPQLTTTADKNAILIGEQLNIKVTATYDPSLFKVNWLNLPDSIAHFEVIDRLKIDTTETNGTNTLQQTIVVTSFDSGNWRTPALEVSFVPLKNDSTRDLFTDSLPVKVSYVADTTKDLKDIKPIHQVETTDLTWYYIIGGLLSLLLIIGAILLYRRLSKKKAPGIFESKMGAYAEALEELEKLKKLDLITAGDIKIYHTRLSEIFRRYASRKLKINLMNKTTGDLLLIFRDTEMKKEQLTDLAAALRSGDAVKFARYAAPVYESENSFAGIKQTIDSIERTPAKTQA